MTMVSEKQREEWDKIIKSVFSEQRMTALALMILPLLFIELTVDLTSDQLFAIQFTDWVIWAIFVAEFSSKFYIARSKWGFLKKNPWETAIDLTIILSPLVIMLSPLIEFAPTAPVVRLVRELRIERLLKAGAYSTRGMFGLRRLSASFYKNKFYHYIIFTAIATLIGSSLIYRLERPINPYFTDYWSALWWCLVTVLTVGGMAATPVTTSGRLVAGGLMAIGIGFVAVLTANFAAFFLEQHTHVEKETTLNSRVMLLLKRNKEVEGELKHLLEEVKKLEREKQ